MRQPILLLAALAVVVLLPCVASAGPITIDTVPGWVPGTPIVRDLQVTPEITAGQTFRTGNGTVLLDTFSLWVANSPGYSSEFDVHLAEWDGERTSGALLYSAVMDPQIDLSAPTQFAFNPGGIQLLANTNYIVFVHMWRLEPYDPWVRLGRGLQQFDGGQAFYLDHGGGGGANTTLPIGYGFSTLSSRRWTAAPFDLAFRASFTEQPDVKPVPEPATFLLVGAGAAGLLAQRRRRE